MFAQVRDEYLAPVLEEIRRDAQKQACGGELRSTHVFRAFEDYFAGTHRHRTLGSWMQDNVFIVLAVFLTVVFGAFGLYHPDDGDVAGFLDIAKIFAGAVVGGAAGSGAAAFSRRRSERGGAPE